MSLICITVHFGKVGNPVGGQGNFIQSSSMNLKTKWKTDIVNEGMLNSRQLSLRMLLETLICSLFIFLYSSFNCCQFKFVSLFILYSDQQIQN